MTLMFNKVFKKSDSFTERAQSLANKLKERFPDMDSVDLQALLMDLLGAGHDTTANLVTFALACLLETPAVLEELTKEVNNSMNILKQKKLVQNINLC